MSAESPITPSVGRIVLVRGAYVLPGDPSRELPGIVTRVWGQNCINVQVFGDSDAGHVTSVTYSEDPAEPMPYAGWRWMPYQVQKAAEDAK